MTNEPYLITLPKVTGKSGRLSFMDQGRDLPIPVKRIYWIYDVEEGAQRGDHAHVNSDRVIICVKGSVSVALEDTSEKKYSFELNDPSNALYFPRLHWINLKFTADAILVVASSCTYSDDVMITDYDKFKTLSLNKT